MVTRARFAELRSMLNRAPAERPIMRVVVYSHGASTGNGATESLLGLVERLRHRHPLLVVLPEKGDVPDRLHEWGVRTRILPFEWHSGASSARDRTRPSGRVLSWLSWWMRGKVVMARNAVRLPRHVQLIRSFQPDLVYTNTTVISMGAIAAWKLKLPHVWHLREFQDLDYQLTPFAGWGWMLKWIGRSSAVIANSDAVGRYYRSKDPSIHYSVVYNGIADSGSRATRPARTGTRPFTFLMVGQIHAPKGQHLALQAAALLRTSCKDFKLVIVGGGEIEEHTRIARDLGVEDCVDFAGPVTHVDRYYRESDCYLMCSEHEAFGRVLVEAMLHELPVIARRSLLSGTNEILEDGITGHFFDGGSAELSKAMDYVMRHGQEAMAWGSKGRSLVRERFSIERYCSQIEEVWRDAGAGRRT